MYGFLFGYINTYFFTFIYSNATLVSFFNFFLFNLLIFILDVNDLQNVAEALKGAYFPSDKWSSLGLNLGLQHSTLTTIEANHKGDVERCLRECLTEWLNQADNVNESGGPTLDSLAGALMKIRQNAAAGKIKEIGKKTFNELFTIIIIFYIILF